MTKQKPSAALISALGAVLADTYVLAVKSHGYHWNVTGALFPQLHEFFGKQYDGLFEAADVVAERIRALGSFAPTGLAQLLAQATVAEAPKQPQDAPAMLADLVKSHETLVKAINKAISIADDCDDNATEDLMIQRRAEHDKTLWMLRSMVG
jgi:starvation-inducible DNA-binding protein